MPDAPKSRFPAYQADARTDLLAHWNRVLRELDTRLLGVEGRKASFEEAEAQMRGIALARINEALLPAFLILETLTHFGIVFEATSETELTVGEGSKTLVIPADKRSLFAPSSYLALRKADDADVVMTGALVEYSRESGVLTVLVDQTRGEGTHSAWSIAPSSAPQFDAYTRGQVDGLFGAAVTGLLGGAPGNLNTLAKIAASIGNEPDFAGVVSAALSAVETSLSQATNIATSQTIAGADDVDGALVGLEAGIEEILADPWWLQPIGKWIPLERDDHLPPNNKGYKYIIARAGLTGSEEYNEGKLDTESVTGSFPLVVATARVIVEGSPKFHHTINLIDTEGRSLRGSTSPGTVQNDQMQTITGSLNLPLGGAYSTGGGVFSLSSATSNGSGTGSGSGFRNASFSSADSSNARTGNETRAKNIGVIHAMRVL